VTVGATRSTTRRIPAFSAVVLLLIALVCGLGAPAAHGQVREKATVRAGQVTMTVDDVRPNTPTLSRTPQPLDISLTLVNNGATLDNVVISAARGDPITSQAKLDAAIARPKPPSGDLVAPLDTTLETGPLLGHGNSMDLLFPTTTDIPTDADICLCTNAIYPLYFTADYTPPDGPTERIAVAQTYLPSFNAQPAKTQVSWVWPLLDRPHRLFQTRVFRDDDLAQEVSPGGRLDQLLQVVETVGKAVPMTLLTDPDLIDELAVMTQGYRVRTGKTTTAGTGGTAAALWLARLRDVLTDDRMELAFTAFGDPAVEPLEQAGLSWSTQLPDPAQAAAAQARVSDALGGDTAPADIVWPAGSTITTPTLTTVVGQGAKTVIVNDKTLPKGSTSAVVPNALAPLPTSSGQAIAAVTSSPIEHWAAKVLATGGPGLAALPKLVAEMAIRVVTGTEQPHYVVITPPRHLTVDPYIAERAILATADTPWSTALPLRAATDTIAPVGHGQLRGRVPSPQLPGGTAENLRYVADTLPGVRNLYADAAAQKLALGNVPIGAQRCASTSLLFEPALGTACSALVAGKVRTIQNGVHLKTPSDGTYTLASKDSRLPVTIVNSLPARVNVRVSVTTVNRVPGFSAPSVERTIEPNSTVQLRVATHVDRVGRIDVRVTLTSPAPHSIELGSPVTLTVHSTALGTVGVVITIVAALVLIVALFVRFIRRMRYRRSHPPKRKTPPAVPTATATP
jgi:hypothetical protein